MYRAETSYPSSLYPTTQPRSNSSAATQRRFGGGAGTRPDYEEVSVQPQQPRGLGGYSSGNRAGSQAPSSRMTSNSTYGSSYTGPSAPRMVTNTFSSSTSSRSRDSFSTPSIRPGGSTYSSSQVASMMAPSSHRPSIDRTAPTSLAAHRRGEPGSSTLPSAQRLDSYESRTPTTPTLRHTTTRTNPLTNTGYDRSNYIDDVVDEPDHFRGSHSSSPASPALSSSVDRTLATPFGFRNCGNTCYLNATLQCIVHTPKFMAALIRHTKKGKNSGLDLVSYLVELMENRGTTGPLLMGIKKKTSLLNAEFIGGHQNDGHELLRASLHALHDEVNRVKGKYRELVDIPGESDEDAAKRWGAYHKEHDDSLVYDIYGGQLRHVTKCSSCNYRSLTFDPFLDLSIALKKGGLATSLSSLSLVELLRDFSEPEDLKGKDQWMCPRCKKFKDARRQTTVTKWPETLVIHLKRFSSTGSKNSAKVKYPKQMAMPELTCGQHENTATPVYTFNGVVYHSGSANFGHYTSHVRSPADQNYYYCDDSRVSKTTSEEAFTDRAGAYILFYQRDRAAEEDRYGDSKL